MSRARKGRPRPRGGRVRGCIAAADGGVALLGEGATGGGIHAHDLAVVGREAREELFLEGGCRARAGRASGLELVGLLEEFDDAELVDESLDVSPVLQGDVWQSRCYVNTGSLAEVSSVCVPCLRSIGLDSPPRPLAQKLGMLYSSTSDRQGFKVGLATV